MQALLVGIGAFALSVLVESIAVAAGVSIFEAMIRRGRAEGSFRNITFVLHRITPLLLASHLVQIALWGVVFMLCGQFDDFGTAFYHSAVNYTTLGYGDLVMAQPWRLLGPIEAMAGTLMAGLSAAILFAVLHRLIEHRLADPQATDPNIAGDASAPQVANPPASDLSVRQSSEDVHP